MSWPNGIAARGEFRRTPGHAVDIVPTLLEITGGTAPDKAPPAPAPGASLVSQFEKDSNTERESIWWFHDGHKAIRMGNWKAVAPIGEPWELYNLANDRQESTDLAIPEASQLQQLVASWEQQMADIQKLAAADLPPRVVEAAKGKRNQPAKFNAAQEAARPKRSQVLLGGESFRLNDRHAFLMAPKETAARDENPGKPWIFYGPTLSRYPDKAESWMHQQFLDAGVAVAGVDVGEAYGSPHAFPHFEALYQEMLRRGYSKTPALLGRSRGGLWVSSWALEHPERVAGIGGIYPVYDYTTYPGTKRAAVAYGLSEEQLDAQQAKLNPIKRAAELAATKIPILIIHGKDDTVVPLAANSAELERIYGENGAEDLIDVIKVDGQGHNFWPGFFHCQQLVDFLIAKAKK